MKPIKVVLGSFCLLFAPLLFLIVVADARFQIDWLLILAGCGLVVIGLFLVLRRNSPMTKVGRISFVLNFGLCIVFLTIGLQIFAKTHACSCSNACVNNLRQIDAAINEWALEQGKTNGTVVAEDDIKPYIKLDAHGNVPKCPDGGKYSYGRVGDSPQITCSLSTATPAHKLP